MLETADITEMQRHYRKAHILRAQAFHALFTLRPLRDAIKKRAAKPRPALQSCPC
ncbi:hypothetical protein [Aliiroseovarius crassostreae]|uniref:hypothetical protein n=1 Tax=Aliiroseovarius crassostreae TaxID=154981 RepID=UPI00220B7D43|nr:hypothetical protein [Aliiroseovarius crassostreae]UWQ04288.1 hypothetical protein K3X22_11460 [Aliiroseovarius crassostreae]